MLAADDRQFLQAQTGKQSEVQKQIRLRARRVLGDVLFHLGDGPRVKASTVLIDLLDSQRRIDFGQLVFDGPSKHRRDVFDHVVLRAGRRSQLVADLGDILFLHCGEWQVAAPQLAFLGDAFADLFQHRRAPGELIRCHGVACAPCTAGPASRTFQALRFYPAWLARVPASRLVGYRERQDARTRLPARIHRFPAAHASGPFCGLVHVSGPPIEGRFSSSNCE
ncbi:hypothetical protein [Rhizobium lusitanum]|uniref:hypothetical protein n=1 Tax=Rhizobium lusitanum TaxID=293958 RepID=UPI001FF07D41|nr:hypothetical protein [Rhizobium lusitanum]